MYRCIFTLFQMSTFEAWAAKHGKTYATAAELNSARAKFEKEAASSHLSPFEKLKAKLTRNGAERESYLWRQSDTEVERSSCLRARWSWRGRS